MVATRDEHNLLIAAAVVVVVVVMFFLAAWIKRRNSRPAPGDFAEILTKGNVADALQAQNTSGAQDARDALHDTKAAIRAARAYGRRLVNLVWALFAGLFCAFCLVFVLASLTTSEGVSWTSTLVFAALSALAGWFARVQWRSFRAPVSAHLAAMDDEGWLVAWRKRSEK
ncbi:hypothetical protein [Rhodoferax aquaticus]|uniref:Uncharacterized protein n=1 Tax=Rhodoferax aquaticus TaxID=2527691 RepID=A0A515ETH5_9BURK|nr:hypothetical protein [Rhodoferax aquaticus]QDL55959.1 hypothetical protein EXZ61_18245 [Rhodoferax aquaticus]